MNSISSISIYIWLITYGHLFSNIGPVILCILQFAYNILSGQFVLEIKVRVCIL